MNKAIFLDRDGVINLDMVHVHLKEEFVFSPGIFDLCIKFRDAGYIILVITNQAGIAKGIYTEDQFVKLTEWMKEQFRDRGISIAKVYHCPHHPDITEACECRKPGPGMILQAVKDFDLNISDCILIGDKESDLQAGRNAGIPETNLYFYSRDIVIRQLKDK